MKRVRGVVLGIMLLCSPMIGMFTPLEASAASAISVTIDGQVQSYPQPPVLVNDRLLVPLRGVFESLGATVEWDDATQTVTAQKDGVTIVLKVGSKTAYKNNQPIPLDAEPRLIQERTMVPIRFVGESLGAQVEWDDSAQTVKVSSGKAGAERQKLSPQQISDQNDSRVVMIEIMDKNGETLGQGSGFVIKEGFILTNYHVMAEAKNAVVHDNNDKTYAVQGVVAYDKSKDLAVIKLADKGNFTPVKLGSAKDARKGEHIVAIGSPYGLQNTVTDGIISGFRDSNGVSLVQISVPIAPGSSGGALFNDYGEVIAVTSSGVGYGLDLNFAVSVEHALPWLNGILARDFASVPASFNLIEQDEAAVIQSLKSKMTRQVIDSAADKNKYGLSPDEAGMIVLLPDAAARDAFQQLTYDGKKKLIYDFVHAHWGDSAGVKVWYVDLGYQQKLLASTSIFIEDTVDDIYVYTTAK